jgi:pimeloyl-ACP methyl ester carboxylesterase
MSIRRHVLKAVVLPLVIGCAGGVDRLPATRAVDPAVERLGSGFVSRTAGVNGTTLHYVRGGTGSAVILLHGFPQDWSEFHRVMPRLAKKFTVVAVDLRGVGGSAATPGGYDAPNLAEDVHQLARHLELGQVYVVGHDIGGMVAYAFARRYPSTTRGVMILDVPLPGVEPWQEGMADPRLWHVGFHQTPGLPEKMIAGRQFVYFREAFFDRFTLDRNAVSDGDVTRYAGAYASADQLRAGLELYRAFPANEAFNAAQRSPIHVPLVLAGGDHSFGTLLPRLAGAVRALGWTTVVTEIIEKSGHYVADEQPERVADLIERHAAP